MLLRNILALVCVLGMALAIPVEKNAGLKKGEVEVVVTDAEEIEIATPGVEKSKKAADVVTKVAKEAEPTEIAKSPEPTAVAEAEEEAATAVKADANAEEESGAPFIPENAEPDVDTSVCSKDLLLMGNKVEGHHVCDGIYNACTEKELISVIMYYYSKASPVSIEYTINEGINKGSVTEKCGNVLINSKIFKEGTTIISGDITTPDPAKKITMLDQDIPIGVPDTKDSAIEAKKATLKDEFVEFSEDEIE